MRKVVFISIGFWLWLLLAPCWSMVWEGKCIHVADGDTVTILAPNHEHVKVRLYGIDAPEGGQDFGNIAKRTLSELAHGKVLRVEEYDIDKYGRTVAMLYDTDGTSINAQLVSAGVAWVYRKYCVADFCGQLLDIEQRAKDAKRGLWARGNTIPPWEYRLASTTHADVPNKTPKGVPGIKLHGNVNSFVYHGPSCKHYKCKNCTRVFSSHEEAKRAGFKPCGKCGGR